MLLNQVLKLYESDLISHIIYTPKFQNFLKNDKILQLILNTINIKGVFYNEQKCEEILSKCINASIELCLDVNELDYLLKEILPILEEKGYLGGDAKRVFLTIFSGFN